MKRWNVKQVESGPRGSLGLPKDISPVIVQLLLNRGINDPEKARAFLNSSVSELYNPFLMEGMHESVSRLLRAINKKEKILIHGDYDVDGVTATTLLFLTLKELGADPVYYIPDRLIEGYGLGGNGVEEAKRVKAGLLITVDCGISSHEEVNELNRRGIDVIITDHHEPPDILPEAYAIINPLQKRCAYPDKDLSGVSVVFKLCQALCSELNKKDFWKRLDLVALGTISDVAPILGENRILVKEGLKLIESGPCNKGIKALLEVAGLKKKKLGAFDIGFILGPRINAIGRLGSADTAVKLFLAEDEKEAKALAEKLNEANKERQKIEKSTLKEAMAKIESEVNFKEHKVLVLHKEDWHAGVIGIVASRISDRFYRPAILISTKDGMGRGSGRSIESFHLFEALAGCSEFLKEYGGHQYACGLTIQEENLAGFTRTINQIADNVLNTEDLIPALDIDMEIEVGLLNHDLVEDLAGLEPFGEGNPEPVFCSRSLTLAREPRILKGEHVKLWVTDGKKTFEAIGFGMAKDSDAEILLRKRGEFDLAYTVSINTWQGIDTIQMRIEDIRPSSPCRP
ncbi:MAG: single-stranded-DNA-specific exonuclease RecJ [Candidatus Omnitrophota bacterium]